MTLRSLTSYKITKLHCTLVFFNQGEQPEEETRRAQRKLSAPSVFLPPAVLRG